MTGAPVAHVAGLPAEETIGALGPVLLLLAGAVSARVSALAYVGIG